MRFWVDHDYMINKENGSWVNQDWDWITLRTNQGVLQAWCTTILHRDENLLLPSTITKLSPQWRWLAVGLGLLTIGPEDPKQNLQHKHKPIKSPWEGPIAIKMSWLMSSKLWTLEGWLENHYKRQKIGWNPLSSRYRERNDKKGSPEGRNEDEVEKKEKAHGSWVCLPNHQISLSLSLFSFLSLDLESVRHVDLPPL